MTTRRVAVARPQRPLVREAAMWLDIPGEDPVSLTRAQAVERTLGPGVDHVTIRTRSASRVVPLPPHGDLSIEVNFASLPWAVRHRQLIRVAAEGEEWGSLPLPVWVTFGMAVVALVVASVGLVLRSSAVIYGGIAVAGVASLACIVAYARLHWRLADRT